MSAQRARRSRRRSNSGGRRSPARTAAIVGALGVVFGDIGTSPIYAVFLAMAHTAADAAEYFNLPRERTVIVGARIYI